MHALVYTDTQTIIYREEDDPKLINGESIIKVSASAFKQIHDGLCTAPKIVLLV